MHIYKNSNGDWLPSVTEIIQKTRPAKSIEKLELAIENKKLREGMSEGDWEEHMKKAQDRGTQTHLYMETYLPLVERGNKEIINNGKCSRKTYDEIKNCQKHFESKELSGEYCKAITSFVYDLNRKTRNWNVLTTEAEVINEKHQYGGRTDSLICLEGENLLLDLKTNGGYWSNWQQRQIYKWAEWIKSFDGTIIETTTASYWDFVDEKLKDKFVQLALYIMAMRDMMQRKQFKWEISKAAILVAFPGQYQYIKMEHRVWAGCFEESERRVVDYMSNHLENWKIQSKKFVSANPDIQI